ncbi:MAG: right-handed parallel beta-helix repeat-containing protein [Clostridia bacterium]|nr:right-handed parallel beta-helix repeat-containing protein [Clostridia bacterium]
MTEFLIRLSDRGEKGDITRFLQDILQKARNTDGEKIIRFEKGEYHFYADFTEKQVIYASNTDSDRFPEKRAAIDIHKQKNLIFDGGGSEFLMHGKMIAVKVTESENITLSDFSWNFPTAGTLEMKVVGGGRFFTDFSLPEKAQWKIKGNQLLWFEVSPFSGDMYWCNRGQSESHCVVVHDTVMHNVARYSLSDGPFFMARKISKLGENKLRVHYFRPAPALHKNGMIFEMCTSYKRDCVGSFFCDSKNIFVKNINVHYMHGFGWLTQMCENVAFHNCNFRPEKNTDRFCTGFADLIHVSGAKGKIHIENCSFSNAHDDPINIHGTYTRVRKALTKNTLLVEYVHNQQNGFTQYHAGDKVVFYKRDTLEPFQNEKEFTVKSVINPLIDGNSVKEMIVEFYEDIPDAVAVKGSYACENVTYTPEVYIGSCHFDLIPTRGILCTTRKKVLIENNVFDGMTMSSIYLSNDCNNWYESGPIRDMTIRDNEFFIRKSPHKDVKAAVFIDPIVADGKEKCPQIHSNITIESNIFHMEHDNAVNAKYCENLVIRNNIIDKIQSDNCESEIKAFRLNNCKNAVIESNKLCEGVSDS